MIVRALFSIIIPAIFANRCDYCNHCSSPIELRTHWALPERVRSEREEGEREEPAIHIQTGLIRYNNLLNTYNTELIHCDLNFMNLLNLTSGGGVSPCGPLDPFPTWLHFLSGDFFSKLSKYWRSARKSERALEIQGKSRNINRIEEGPRRKTRPCFPTGGGS